MSALQPCGRQLRACIDDVCRSMGECAWPPETPAGLDTGGKRDGTADSVSSEVKAAPSRADEALRTLRAAGADCGPPDERLTP